mgnify:CR=1 FL=1
MAQDESEVTETTPAGDVRVERAVRRKEGGVTVEYTVRGPDGETAEFRIREPLDESVPLTEAGFHPEQEPRAWSVEDDAVTFEDEIPADGTFETVFGAVADEPFFGGEPLVERTDKESKSESKGFLGGLKRRLFGGGSSPESEPGDVTPVPESEAGAAGTTANGGEPDGVTILADAEQDLDAGGPSDEADANENVAGEDIIDEAEEDNEADGDDEPTAETPDSGETGDDSPDEDNDMDTDTEDDGAADSEAEPTDDAAVEEAEPSESEKSDDDVSVETLVDALETDEELRAAFRDALGVETGEDDHSKSTDVRLRHVQSRVDDLAAYTHTLEEAIDQHGPPAEVLSDLKSETEALREDVTTLREEQAATREQVDELAETTESLRTELAEAGERRDARLDGVESDVDGVATDLRATRDELNAELDDVREELDALQEMRESLTAAFGGTGAMGGMTEEGQSESEEQPEVAEPNEERRG